MLIIIISYYHIDQAFSGDICDFGGSQITFQDMDS